MTTVLFAITLLLSSFVKADIEPAAIQKIFDQAKPSLVAVQYTWESEFGRREIVGAGVIVSTDGLVMTPLAMFDPRIPDEQMKDFKILVPTEDDVDEIDAIFQGRDERTSMAFLKTKEPQSWKSIHFATEPAAGQPVAGIGQPVVSVGLLPKAAGYRAYAQVGRVSANLRGEYPQVLISGALAALGSPVFTLDGKAIGFVNQQSDQPVLLNEPKTVMLAITRPPVMFTPASDFALSLADPPTGKQLQLPWIGVPQLTGVKKEVAEYFGLQNQPAVEIGDIIPSTPAEKAGLKANMIIVKVNGQPLERGDEPAELPMILRRKLIQMKVGQTVTFTVLPAKGAALKDIPVVLEEQPKRPTQTKRYYAEDLGFVVREMAFMDTYTRRLPAAATGLVIAGVRPQGAAQNAKMEGNDLVLEINGEVVKDLEQFKQLYQTARKAKPREAVVLVILREGRNQTIRVEPPQ